MRGGAYRETSVRLGALIAVGLLVAIPLGAL
jgi:hypothetical protein